MTCHRHQYCQQCDEESNLVLGFTWTLVVIGLVILACLKFT